MSELFDFAKELAEKSDEELIELRQNRRSLSKDKQTCLDYEFQRRDSLMKSKWFMPTPWNVDKQKRRKAWMTVIGALVTALLAVWSILSRSCQ